MVLVLLTAPPGRRQPLPGWPAVLARLAAATQATDVVGWYEPDVVLGLVCPLATVRDGVGVANGGSAAAPRGLGTRLERDLAGACAVRVLVHPEPVPPVGEALRAVDPAWYPELVFRRRADRRRDAAKRALDVAGSSLALLLLAPALAAIAILVRATSPGPALFGQTRVGHRARPFTMRKFRTMYVHADATVHREFVSRFIADGGRDGNPSPANGVFKLTNDRRITPLGRVLRKTSLDELPQLWNVLRGDMSLVGPRPPVPYEYAQYRPWHRRRVVDVKPGITGLWQVVGRSRTTFDEMVRMDLRYAQTRSLGRDLALIGRTPAAVISGKGAC